MPPRGPSGETPEPLVNLNARAPKGLWRRTRVQCVKEGRLLRDFVTEALRDRLKKLAVD